MSPPSSSWYTFESPLIKLSDLEMAQTHMERVVGDSPGQDRRDFLSWAGLSVCKGQCRRPFLSPEPVFLGEALGMGLAGTARGQPARGHVSERCSCLRDSVWLWALQSEWRLDGSCARSPLAQPRPAQRQVLRPHRVQAPGPGGRALGEGVMRTSDLTGGCSLWDWMGSM